LGTAVAPEGLASTMGPGGCGIGVKSNLGVLFQPKAAGRHLNRHGLTPEALP